MKSFDVYSRYGKKFRADLIDENTIHFFPTGAEYMRTGAGGEMNSVISYIDPEGGPFIALWELASDVLHEDLPSREIMEIVHKEDYYAIKLQPAKKEKKLKEEKTKRVTKVKEQKILKSRKHVK